MRLVLTGGGTGGHIHPALEVGRYARGAGADLRYFGSFVGMESASAAKADVPFVGYPSGPLYRRFRWSTVKTAAGFARAIFIARQQLRGQTDVVFSTGGYGAAPTMYAARALGIPYVIHDSNSVPGRSNRIFANQAKAFTAAFRKTLTVPGLRADRTGQPIREALRDAVGGYQPERMVLVLGGSQGSVFLNGLAIETARLSPGTQFLIAAGRNNADAMIAARVPDNAEVVPYLEPEALIRAYRQAGVVLARSGGTLAEIAMFGLPSVLVPLPSSADEHQLFNAQEFREMEAAVVLWPEGTGSRANTLPATAARAASEIEAWLDQPTRREVARHNLGEWDIPDATARIFAHLTKATR